MIQIDNLIIETTRQCQLECEHCLRGDTENITMKRTYMENLLKNVDCINTVTFTGGEPFLHPETMHEFITICKWNKIEVGSFYVATNGLIFEQHSKLAEQGLMAITKLFAICIDNECSAINISRDQFHYEDVSLDNLLYAFAFTSIRDGLDYSNCIAEGRAEHWGGRTEDNSIDWNYPDEVQVYLNCEGKVCWNCDLRYENQRECGLGIDGAKHTLEQINDVRLEKYA